MTASGPDGVRLLGRYALHGELASGGMAAVHLGRLLGPVGFARTVAIKRLHSHHARDPEFVSMLLDEARIVARIKHPNVVPTLDVVTLEGELFLVMEYVHGAPISKIMGALARRKERMPVNVAAGICVGLLEGLHAAHEAKSEDGSPLRIVHRDVSPQNVIVGADGIPRVLDFGIAKAAERLQVTESGSFKGKLGYMPPDVLAGGPVDRRTDLWGAAVVFWEMLVGKRLFGATDSPHGLVRAIVEGEIEPPSRRGVEISRELDAVLVRALTKNPEERYATAREMASAIEEATPVASGRVIGEWLAGIIGDQLEERAALVEEMERSTRAKPPSAGTLRTFVDGGSGPQLPQPPEASAPVDAPAAPGSSLRGTSAEVPAIARASDAIPDAPAPLPKGRRNRRAAFLAGVLGALLLAGTLTAGALVVRGRDAVPLAATRPPPSVAPGDGTGSPSLSNPPEPSAARATSAADGMDSSATPDPSGASTAASKPAVVAPKPPVRGRARPSPSPKSCNPPYTIGPPPDYIRKPKLECLPQ